MGPVQLGVERIEFLIEALVGRFAGVDRAAEGEPGSSVIRPGHHSPPPLNENPALGAAGPEAEEPRARPAGAGDLSRDHGEGVAASGRLGRSSVLTCCSHFCFSSASIKAG
jgi:hypothetical protein